MYRNLGDFLTLQDGSGLADPLFGDITVAGGGEQPDSRFDESDKMPEVYGDLAAELYVIATEEVIEGVGYVAVDVRPTWEDELEEIAASSTPQELPAAAQAA